MNRTASVSARDEPLPIDPVLPDLVAALRSHGCAVLQAPPGAGKTTRVPLALLEADLVPGLILMLEPRRVAARAAAERLAASLGEAVGGRVGYRIRGESRSGTAIEVVTEGILTRMLQSDPELAGIGAVLFDEFHERALAADLGLALALEVRAALRPDLLLLAMSATLDAAPVATLMGDAPIVTAEGRAFPVETVHLERPLPSGTRLEPATAELVLQALSETQGGLLVFLPGQREILRTADLLRPRLPHGISIQPLYGAMPFAAQRTALVPVENARKLVLATAIAETSLTIPDIRVVVDAGRARRARFDPGSGMARLVTERVSRAEAEQRRGRAGRVAPGRCYRLWTRGEEGALALFAPPEIAVADLAQFALELSLWGAEASALPFLTPPPAAPLAEARALLRDLGALDADGRITPHGRSLAALPVHPRLGHMLVAAAAAGATGDAADLAALLEERDPLSGQGGRLPSDLGLRLAALRKRADAPPADAGQLARIREEARRLGRLLQAGGPHRDVPLSPGALLSLAYPDRIGRRRPGPEPRYLLSGGKGARLAPDDPLATAPYLVAADLDGDPREAVIRRALPVAESDLRALHAERLVHARTAEWSRRHRAVLALERLSLGAVALEERPWNAAPVEALTAAMIEGVRALGLGALPWTPGARRFQSRVEWLRARGVSLPDLSDEELFVALQEWLGPFLPGITKADQLSRLDLLGALRSRLDYGQQSELDRLAPSTIIAPTGTRLPVDYEGQPSISVRLQELFGLTEHPTVGPDRTPLLLHLLSPAQKPVQSTADLPGFWASSYADVRRDLRGRYPRHPWPEDPAQAEPTRRAKPRSR